MSGKGRKKRLAKRKKEMAEYGERNLFLVELGYPSYEEYLQSQTWAEIRAAVLAKNPLCRMCRRKATQVHHFLYSKGNLSGTDPTYLFSVCKTCHYCIEFDLEGLKRSVAGARKAYSSRLKWFKRRRTAKSSRKKR